MKFFKIESFRKRKLLIMLSIVLIGVLIMWGWANVSKKGTPGKGAKGAEEAVEPAIPVKTTKAVKSDYQDFVTSFGTIKGFREIPVKFEESARIEKFYFKEGEPISKDELVVSEEQEEQKKKVEYAELEYNKNKTLYDLGAIIKDKLRQAELE